MTDESVVVDNGQTYVSEESAVIATEAVARAKQWAEESETQANLATNSANIAYQARDEAVNVVNSFTQRVTEATNTFNSNATAKTNDFNNNATAKTTAFNDNYTEKKALIDAQAAIAESSATNANNYKNKAREWAISQNIVDNEDYSSKYWARKAEEWAESVVNVANKDLSNLNPQGQNIANWATNVSNCITEIPQDIKLELNNGTLTLKAGSKVYVPNGFESDGTTPKFDMVVIENDISITSTGTNHNEFLFYRNSTTLDYKEISHCYSGTSDPQTNSTAYYDTTQNKLHCYTASGIKTQDSFPLCSFTITSGVITSIDQVFNGFGYIGSTVFALPRVKGLIPNGRNADGSLKNNEFTTSSVLTYTNTANYSGGLYVQLKQDDITGWITYYNDYCFIGNSNWTNGKVDWFTSKTPFHALDYNDKSTISSWGMPSTKTIDLTLGASGATYTAPANGWFLLIQRINAVGLGVVLQISGRTGQQIRNNCSQANQICAVTLPVLKGEAVGAWYGTLSSTTSNNAFKFIYAEGDK